MSTRVFTVSKDYISERSEDLNLWYYKNAPASCGNCYIGDMESYFMRHDMEKYSELKLFVNLMYVSFNGSDLIELEKELLTVENLKLIKKEDSEILRAGINFALERGLHLRFDGN